MLKNFKLKVFCVTIQILFITLSGVIADTPRTLYVLNGIARTLSRMNLETGEINNDIIQIGQWPNQVTSFNAKLYVVNSGTDNIMVIDPQKASQVEKNIVFPQGSNPYFMAFVARNKAYVTNLMANTVSVVDIESGVVLKNIPVGTGPEGIIIVENEAYITNTGGYPDYSGSSVTIINTLTDTVKQTILVPANPQDLALAPDGRIHVLCTGNFADITGKVVVIDRWAGPGWTPAVVDTIQLGGSPGDIVITPAGKGFCCATGFPPNPNNHLYIYDAFQDTIIHDVNNPVLIGANAMRLIYDNLKNVIWVSNFNDDAAQKLNAETGVVIATYGFGDGAQDMTILEPIQNSDPWADLVVSFVHGQNWSHFGEQFFPINVLGPPDPDGALDMYNSSSKPEEILSLGHGGEIVLQFTDNKIINGTGSDFTVFENAFISLFDNSVFAEAAIVSVSQNGYDWVEFPYDTTSMSGFAGVTPTDDNHNPTNPSVSGGDLFDLDDIGLDWVTYVKLTDLGDIYQEGLYNGDFDLDAVVAIHSEKLTGVTEKHLNSLFFFELNQNYPNPFNPETKIDFSIPLQELVQLKVFNHLGQEIITLVDEIKNPGRYHVVWNGKNRFGIFVNSGIYYYKLKMGDSVKTAKMLLIR